MSSTRAAPRIRNIIADRVFQRADGKDVRVVVGRPRKGRRDWACEFQILGLGHSKVYTVPGIDSLDALQMALAMMAAQIASYRQKHGLTFLGDSALLVVKPDVEAMIQELGATSDYRIWSQVFRGHPWFTKGDPPRLRKRLS